MDTELGLSHLHMQSRLNLATPCSMRHLLTIKELQNALIRADWRDAAFLGSACMGAGHASYQRLVVDMITSPEQMRLKIMTDAIQAAVAQLGPPSGRMAVFQRLLGEVRDQAADVQEHWSAPLAALASGDMAPLVETFTPLQAPFDSALTHSVAGTIALLTYGLHANIHAEFNLVYARQHLDVPAILKWNYADAFARISRQFEETLWRWQERLYTSLKNASPATRANDVRPDIDAVTSAIERDLPDFVRKQAVAVAAMNALKLARHDDLVAQMGEKLARAGTLTRKALATYAAAHYLGISLVLPRPPDRLRSVIRIPKPVVFDLPAEVRIRVPLSELRNVGEGDLVQIAGLVTNVEIIRDSSDMKRLSRISIVDPSSGATANAVAIFIHAPHRGLAEGAWVQLTGRYRSASSLLDNTPALEVERIPLSTNAKDSWRIAFLLIARDWMDVWPYGLEMAWSLSPHCPTTASDMLHLGAGELIFRPPVPPNPEL